MVLNTDETKLLNSQVTVKKVLLGSETANKGAVILSTTYIVEGSGYVFIKVMETGADVASGDASLSIKAVNTYQAEFQPSTSQETVTLVGAAGAVFADFVAPSPYPVDTVITIELGASVSTTSAVNYVLELEELITGIQR